METTLSNTVKAVGNYNEIPTSITSAAAIVTMITGLTITKTADKNIWADGNLTYTIVIDNKSEKPYNTPEITDVLDGTLIDFVPNSVTIDGATAQPDDYEYNEGTNTLKINLKNIEVSSSSIVTFQVKKK